MSAYFFSAVNAGTHKFRLTHCQPTGKKVKHSKKTFVGGKVPEVIMKETIYTIPINEAYDTDCECPLCFLKEKLEREAVEYALGPAMMEPDYRIKSNAEGFCEKHFSMLFARTEKLSLGLVLDTHLESIRKDFSATVKNATALKSQKSGFLKKNPSVSDFAEKVNDFCGKATHSCVVCDKINYTMARYTDLIIEMWKNNPEFKKKFEASKAVCIPHFSALISAAAKKLNSSDAADFISFLSAAEEKELKRIQEDIHKFTLKFDYRNKDMEWGSAKDAPVRTIEKLAGNILKEL